MNNLFFFWKKKGEKKKVDAHVYRYHNRYYYHCYRNSYLNNTDTLFSSLAI